MKRFYAICCSIVLFDLSVFATRLPKPGEPVEYVDKVAPICAELKQLHNLLYCSGDKEDVYSSNQRNLDMADAFYQWDYGNGVYSLQTGKDYMFLQKTNCEVGEIRRSYDMELLMRRLNSCPAPNQQQMFYERPRQFFKFD